MKYMINNEEKEVLFFGRYGIIFPADVDIKHAIDMLQKHIDVYLTEEPTEDEEKAWKDTH